MIRVITLIVAATTLLVAAGAALAQAPTTFLYQGRLTNPAGAPITDPVEVTFRIVSGLGDPSILFFTQVEPITPDANGVFTVELGPVPANTFTGAKRYLSIKVGDDPEMDPRQPIAATPYAMSAEPAPPGIAQSAMYNFSAPVGSGSTMFPVDSVTVQVPASGYIQVQATGYFNLTNAVASSGSQWVRASINRTATSVDFDNFAWFELHQAGTYYESFAITYVEAVAAGSHKYYLNSSRGSETSSGTGLNRIHLVATYFPTAIGTVEPTKIRGKIQDGDPQGLLEPESQDEKR